MFKNIEKYIGRPFEDGGRGAYALDCWGLVREIFFQYGMRLPDYSISCFDSEKISNEIDERRSDWIRIERIDENPMRLILLDNTP